MRVLWLTNHIMPDLARALGRATTPRRGWIPALADVLVESGRVELAMAPNIRCAALQEYHPGAIKYYVIPMRTGRFGEARWSASLPRLYQRVVEDFRPDLIHVHGTESWHGLLTGRGYLQGPALISMQGILEECERHYWGGLSLGEVWAARTLRDWIRLDGLLEQKRRRARDLAREREIFRTNSAFTGRTAWDRAHLRRLNPAARYYHCDRQLREAFYRTAWDLPRIRRHSVFASAANYPLKGFHVLVRAAALLRREFPDLTIRTPLASFYPTLSGLRRFWRNCRTNGYAKYLTDLIRAEGLGRHIVPLPDLDAEAMAGELARAHVFVLPSLIENSPNALAEAMLVGTPSVASFVGGVPSMTQDGASALLFPPGDESVLAEQLREIFLQDELALRLSACAREVARSRHCKEKIVGDMLAIYERERG